MPPAADLVAAAAEASRFLGLLANEKRLLVLCMLVEGELTVGSLAERVGLSQSALSQHLQKLRDEGLVATRRDGQSIHYRLADAKVTALITLLHSQFCPPDTAT